jgi:hypothetical protein
MIGAKRHFNSSCTKFAEKILKMPNEENGEKGRKTEIFGALFF